LGAAPKGATTAKGALNPESAFALAKQIIALPAEEAATREVVLAGTVEGKLVALVGSKVSAVGPVLALLVNVTEKKEDQGVTHWVPHLFVMKSQGDTIAMVAHLEPPDLTHDVEQATDKGSKLSLSKLQVTKDAAALVATLRKEEGNTMGGNVEETMVAYLVQKDTLAIAFSTKTEVSSSEKLDGVMETKRELNKVELGKKGNRLVDLVVTTRKIELKDAEAEEYRPTTERWCWNDRATSYLPGCK